MTHRRWWKRLVAGLLLPLLVGVGLAQALDARRFIEVYGSGGWTRVQQWQQADAAAISCARAASSCRGRQQLMISRARRASFSHSSN